MAHPHSACVWVWLADLAAIWPDAHLPRLAAVGCDSLAWFHSREWPEVVDVLWQALPASCGRLELQRAWDSVVAAGGDDMTTRPPVTNVNAALRGACGRGDVGRVADLLLHHGADVDAAAPPLTDGDPQPACHCALFAAGVPDAAALAVLRVMAACGGTVALHQSHVGHSTACGALFAKPRCVLWLLRHDAVPTGDTPPAVALLFAAVGCYAVGDDATMAVCRALDAHAVVSGLAPTQQRRLLQCACAAGKPATVDFLLAAGVSAVDTKGAVAKELWRAVAGTPASDAHTLHITKALVAASHVPVSRRRATAAAKAAASAGKPLTVTWLVDVGVMCMWQLLLPMVRDSCVSDNVTLAVCRAMAVDYTATPHVPEHSPLHAACASGKLQCLNYFASRGVRAAPLSESAQTLLHAAMHSTAADDASVSVAEWVMAHDPSADVNATATLKYTPLHQACDFGKVECVRWLLANGADVAARTEAGATPLHCAVVCWSESCTEDAAIGIASALLAHGADVNATCNGATAVHKAMARGNVATALWLLRHGARGEDELGSLLSVFLCGTVAFSVSRALLLPGVTRDDVTRVTAGATPAVAEVIDVACGVGRRPLLWRGGRMYFGLSGDTPVTVARVVPWLQQLAAAMAYDRAQLLWALTRLQPRVRAADDVAGSGARLSRLEAVAWALTARRVGRMRSGGDVWELVEPVGRDVCRFL